MAEPGPRECAGGRRRNAAAFGGLRPPNGSAPIYQTKVVFRFIMYSAEAE